MNDLKVPCYLSRNIHVNNLIGEDGFAKIYRGKFNHLSVAIKIQHGDNLSSKNEMLVLTTFSWAQCYFLI
uniref:Protein kinase domain-containing protein n=1 Tax=Strongyloides stercoralis TaxID=6248 RepID=A0A0K0DZW4_STRER